MTVKTSVGLPLVGKSDVTVEGSITYSTTETKTTTKTFAWSQPVLVPAKRRVIGTVAITETTLEVPYTVVGDYVYDSGFRVPAASTAGTPAPRGTTCRSISTSSTWTGHRRRCRLGRPRPR